MKVVMSPGDSLMVEFEDTDGAFVIEYGNTAVTVIASLADDMGRENLIYHAGHFNFQEDEDEASQLPT